MNGAVEADSDTVLVQMNNINRLERPRQEADGEFRVWAEAGATLGEVAAALSRDGLAFSCLPQSPKITLGGMIANGVHGSSLRESAVLAEQVTGMELITSSGELIVVPPELLPLARINLGCLGAITRLQIEVVPNFELISSSEVISADVALETEAVIADLRAHDFQLSYTYDPLAGTVTRRTLDRVKPSQAHHFKRLPRKKQYDQGDMGWVTQRLLALGAHLPNAFFGFRDQVKKHIREGFMPIEHQIGEARLMFQTNLDHPAHDMAYAVPIRRCGAILKMIAREFERIGYQTDLPLGMRFLRGTDKTSLALNSGEDVVVIEWASLIEFNDTREAFKVFERVLYEAGGRPHWAKEFSFNPKAAYPADTWNAFASLSARWGWKFANRWSRQFTPAGDAQIRSP
jgi:FAD/FMN-containing dehydrogenase